MELRHLRYFVAVAETGSMTRAAAVLGIQQPPLSQQIQALEREVGVPLFDRFPRRIVLNGAGRIFLEDARRILQGSTTAVERVRRFARGEEGRLAIGFTSSASLHALAPRLIRRFREAYPRVGFAVEESETYALLIALEHRQLDAALLRIEVDAMPGLQGHTLDQDALVLVVPRGHPLDGAPQRPVTLDALRNEPFVMYRRTDGPGIYDTIAAAFAKADFAPHVVDTVSRIIAAINLVAAGRGITLVPASMRAFHSSLVRYRPLAKGMLPNLPLTLVHRRDDVSPVLRNFVAVAEEEVEDGGRGSF